LHLFGLGDPLFFKLQHGSGLEERGQAATKSDVGDRVMQTGVEAADDVVDQVLVAHRCAEAGKSIRHDLHLGAVVEDGEVTLVEAAELGTEVNGARVLVVAEEVADGAPEGIRGVGILRHHGEQLR
jgi:hypothetical protein